MNGLSRLVGRIDDWQARVRPVAFIVGVAKKYGDDNASQLAALITYYGFLSVFPLMLATGVVLSLVLEADPTLQQDIFDQLVSSPEVRQDLENAVARVSSAGWWVLLISLGAFLFSALGGVSATYSAFNQIWAVPIRERLAFGPRYLRMLAVLLATVLGVLAAVVLYVRVLPKPTNDFTRVVAVIVTVAIVVLVFWLSTQLLVRVKPVGPGVAIASILGGVLVAGFGLSFSLVVGLLITRAGPVYGGLASVVGVLAFLFLTMQAVVIASEVGSVWAWRLWPRGLDLSVPREGDLRAYQLYAQTGLRAPGEEVSVNWRGKRAAQQTTGRRTPTKQTAKRR
jgi:membrane protein